MYPQINLHHLAGSLQLPCQEETPQYRCVQQNKPSAARFSGPEITESCVALKRKLLFRFTVGKNEFPQAVLVGHVFLPGLFRRQAFYLTGCTVLISQTAPCKQSYTPPHWTQTPPFLKYS